MNTHSTGPWIFNKKEKVWTISDASGYPMMGNERYYPWVPSDEADWNLIAAAPDLLEALKDALNVLDATGANDAANAVRAAIAKAEGA